MAYSYTNKGTLINGQVNTNNGFRHFGHGKQQLTTNAHNPIITFNWSSGASPRIKFSLFGQFTATKPSRTGYLIQFNFNYDIDSNGSVVWENQPYISENGDGGTWFNTDLGVQGQIVIRSYIWGDQSYVNLSMYGTCNKWNYLSSVTYH